MSLDPTHVLQGETNKGAFYWPATRETEAAATTTPSFGVPGGDLVLSEVNDDELDDTATGGVEDVVWLSAGSTAPGWAPMSCTQVCAAHGTSCDAAALTSATSESAFLEQIEDAYACALPLLAGCNGAPRMSGLGDGLCWYHDPDICPLSPSCDEIPQADYASGIRLCPCSQTRAERRDRRLRGVNAREKASAHSITGSQHNHDAALAATAERMAAKAAAGGCPAARLAMQRKAPHDLLNALEECPKAKAMLVAEHGGLNSDTADSAAAVNPAFTYNATALLQLPDTDMLASNIDGELLNEELGAFEVEGDERDKDGYEEEGDERDEEEVVPEQVSDADHGSSVDANQSPRTEKAFLLSNGIWTFRTPFALASDTRDVLWLAWLAVPLALTMFMIVGRRVHHRRAARAAPARARAQGALMGMLASGYCPQLASAHNWCGIALTPS